MLKSSEDIRSKLFLIFQSVTNRVNIFYILAFAPLPLIAYYDIYLLSPSMFGFLLLLLEKREMSPYRKAVSVQSVVGIILILSSFIAYYALVRLPPFMGFTGAINYAAYILGLFITFFEFSALKKAFVPVFVIVAAKSFSFISKWLGLSLSQYVIPSFVTVTSTILNVLGLKVITQYPDVIILNTWRGPIALTIIWACLGVYGTLVFSIVLVVVLSKEPGSLKTKILWAVIGVTGVLVLNIIRVVIILAAAYYYSAEVAEHLFHPPLGYVLFFTWLALFLYMFSKRQAILEKVRSTWHKLL